MGKNIQTSFQEHRSGWAFALDALKRYHSSDGIFVDCFLEQSHSWSIAEYSRKSIVPYKKPWIGFLHNPQNMPSWFDWCNSPQVILQREIFKESLKNCVAICVLSNYFKEWLQQQITTPVIVVKHPTEIPTLKFNLSHWLRTSNRQLVSLGYWLRKMHSIEMLDVPYEKTWYVPKQYALDLKKIEAKTMDTFRIRKGTYIQKQWVPNDNYDRILSTSIAFADYYDVSASNSIIECIARNTPILTNPLPANIEYLGKEYPFYFNDLEEAAWKATDAKTVVDTYNYLANMDKSFLSQDSFAESFHNQCEQVC